MKSYKKREDPHPSISPTFVNPQVPLWNGRYIWTPAVLPIWDKNAFFSYHKTIRITDKTKLLNDFYSVIVLR